MMREGELKGREWKFYKYQEGEKRRDSSSEKHFKGLDINESLIRELIQNSLDARDKDDTPVQVKIGFKELEFQDYKEYFETLEDHYEACGYEEFPKGNKKVKFLILEDFNTMGLEGKKVEDFFEKDNIRIDIDKQGGRISRQINKQPLSGETQGYFIPYDNPFIDLEGALGEFWALGLRNPFRFWIDPRNGEIWAGDVGLMYFEEINRIQKGGNYQWGLMEGLKDVSKIKGSSKGPGAWKPAYYSYPHNGLDRCVIAGFIYRGEKFPELREKYLFAENFGGYLAMIPTNQYTPEGKHIKLAGTSFSNMRGITALRESPSGEIFVVAMGDGYQENGEIYSLVRHSKIKGKKNIKDSQSVNQENGKEIYNRYCVSCHGEKGDGRGFVKTQVVPPNFQSAFWQQSRSDNELKEIIQKGGEINGLSSAMPAWESVLNKKQVVHLVKFLRQFSSN